MKADILLITVNPHEDRELKNALLRHGHQGTECQGTSTLYHYLDFGTINGQSVFLAKSEMGSSTEGASYDTIRKAIKDCSPSIVICVGIAWGGKEDEQKMGDLLISTQIQIAANKKVSEDAVKFRAARPQTSLTAQKTLQIAADAVGVSSHSGILLSEETLFDNKELRNKSLSASSAIGGEMEAAGAIKAIDQAGEEHDRHFELIVAKSICDWGFDKNVDPNEKETNQKVAAENAAKVVVHAIKNYRFVKERLAPEIQKKNAESADVSKTIEELLNCAEGLDFEVLAGNNDDPIPKGSTVYWPVRLRQPNIIHAAQTFVAARLQMSGWKVKLCLDDLGTIEHYGTSDTGVPDFKRKVRSWALSVGDESIANAIVENTCRFSDFLKSADDEKDSGVYAMLGKNLEKWLLVSEDLNAVLSDSKLLDICQKPLLKNKPRRLLSPSVVWTIMECVLKEEGNSGHIATLGGYDEQPIWVRCPQRNKISIHSIFLPKVEGVNMGTDALRPQSRQRLASSLDEASGLREWVRNYLLKFPAQVKKDLEVIGKDWEGKSTRELADAVYKYYK